MPEDRNDNVIQIYAAADTTEAKITEALNRDAGAVEQAATDVKDDARTGFVMATDEEHRVAAEVAEHLPEPGLLKRTEAWCIAALRKVVLVLHNIFATGVTPTKAVGDLAQVSIGATGAETVQIGLMEWEITWKRKTVDSTTTEQNGYAGKLASTAEWSATAKFAYIDGDVNQSTLRSAITTLQYSSQKYNFTNAPATGRDSWSGNAVLTGIKFTSGTGKLFGMDVTLEGDGPLNMIPQLAPMAGTGTQPALVAED